MSRKLKLVSALFALMVFAIAVTSAMAKIDRKTGSNPSSDNISEATYERLNSFAPNSTPTFDPTGRWKSNAGDEMQVFEEKDEVNAILVNSGWAHRLAGRYINPTTIRMVLIRRTRSGGCEVTMDLDLKVNSANSLSGASVASETACGITQGQSFPSTWTRIL
jgi:hypothetical protein